MHISACNARILFYRQWKRFPAAFTIAFPKAVKSLSTGLHEENKVLKQLKAKIEATGPLTVADYMKEALISPYLGYYMKQDVFGSAGDFITSPEISQMFGELIGVWFCNEWLRVCKPQPLQFVEFGPGRGTLADDVLRVFSKLLTPYKVDLSVHLIEVSPHMKQLQMATLGVKADEKSDSVTNVTEGKESRTYITKYGYPVTFHHSLESVPGEFSLFLAHEFFDALPIHKFQKTENGWREVLIDYRDEKLQFVLSRNPTPAAKYLIDPDEKRDHIEVSPEAGILIQNICERMTECGGISLIIDYGHEGDKNDTFRSFKEHKQQDPLLNPGEADLTADVDFSYLKKCIKGKACTVGPISQGFFLNSMGIDIRLKKLMKNATPEVQKSLISGFDMLTKSDQMGERFKVLAVYPRILEGMVLRQPPVGFTNFIM